MVKFLAILVVKMKVKVVAGKVYLPKEVRERVNLLEGGEANARQ
jgi:bifunctional DNA-binding transcriptional regulator/antitoxin component of YhaV-PrlF toxin-antitoxin module